MTVDLKGKLELSSKFHKLNLKLNVLEAEANQKTGILFKTHCYGQDILEVSPTHRNIQAMLAKMADDAEHWQKAGKLSHDIAREFKYHWDQAHARIVQIHKMIQERNPTWWECCRPALDWFAQLVVKMLPMAIRLLLPHHGGHPQLPPPHDDL